jgi:hypothetical protein
VTCTGSTHRLGQEGNICAYGTAYCTTRFWGKKWVENDVFCLSFRSVHTLTHFFIVHFSVFSHWQPEISGVYAAVGLERGPLSLVSTIEELLGRNSSSSGLEIREYRSGDSLCWPRDTLYPQNLVLTSPTTGSRLVGTVCSQTKATEFSFFSGLLRSILHQGFTSVQLILFLLMTSVQKCSFLTFIFADDLKCIMK